MTNADKIRAMSDEELAECCSGMCDSGCPALAPAPATETAPATATVAAPAPAPAGETELEIKKKQRKHDETDIEKHCKGTAFPAVSHPCGMEVKTYTACFDVLVYCGLRILVWVAFVEGLCKLRSLGLLHKSVLRYAVRLYPVQTCA